MKTNVMAGRLHNPESGQGSHSSHFWEQKSAPKRKSLPSSAKRVSMGTTLARMISSRPPLPLVSPVLPDHHFSANLFLLVRRGFLHPDVHIPNSRWLIFHLSLLATTNATQFSFSPSLFLLSGISF